MKKAIALISLATALAAAAATDFLSGPDMMVPCKVIVGFSKGATAYPLTIWTGNSSEEYELGGWNYRTVEVDDVLYAMKNSSAIMTAITKAMADAARGSDTVARTAWSDVLVAATYVIQFNQSNINAAMSVKWWMMQDAIRENADTQGGDSYTAEWVAEVQREYAKFKETFSGFQRKFDVESANMTAEMRTVKATMEAHTREIAELKAKIADGGGGGAGEATARIGELTARVSDLSKQYGVLAEACKKIPALESMLACALASSGIGLAIPPQVSTYSNQMERLSLFLGGQKGQGDAQTGMFALPVRRLEPTTFDDGDPALNPNEAQEEEEEGTSRPDTIQVLLRYLWEEGFVPWLPKEADNTMSAAAAVMWGPQSSNGTTSGGRYFYDEAGEDGGVVTHAVGIEMPVEWQNKTTPWHLDVKSQEWHNAHVQFGNSMDAGNGSYSAYVGSNYARCDLATKTITIVQEVGTQQPGVCYFFIGTVSEDWKVEDGSYHTPIIFMWE